jgi:tRNA pseudouridine32 synthase/23S rRNA pseudouridine746 synthase
LIRLKRQLGLNDLVPLHRIDRDTAGLVLFSVNPSSRAAYAALFRDRQVNKRYEAVAPWRADLTLPRDHHSRIVQSPSYMQMMEAPGLANARTQITLLAHDGRLGHYALCPVTGYRHQLRVQMASLGVPILNDGIYPVLTPECLQGVAPDYSQPLQLLAKTLGFVDPVSGAERRFTSTRHLKAAIYGL